MAQESGTGGPLSVPRNTTPTWEVELLISGVAVFAALQLPGLLDDALFALRPRFGAGWSAPLGMVYVYAKTAAVILAATFVIHLLLRAQWIALVGLLSIHPRGIDWDRLEAGPLTREVERERLGSLDQVVERADNRATTVFAAGVTMAMILVVMTLLVGLVLALATLVPALDPGNALVALFAVVLGTFALAQVADRRLGPRLPEGSRRRRWLRALLAVYARLGLGAAGNPVMGILASHGGRRRVALLVAGIMLLATWGVVAALAAMRAPERLGSYALFPQPAEGAPGVLARAHYDDERDPARDPLVPYVQSAVATGPYLRLVVPYEPQRDEAALRRHCPDLAGLAGAALAARARQCLRAVREVRLDGAVVETPFEVGGDPRTQRPALVAMLDLRGLARGRHELQVARSPSPDAGGTPAAPFRIPFWH